MAPDDFKRRIIGHERDPNDPAQAEKIAAVGNFLHLECGHRLLSFDIPEQIEGDVLCTECRAKSKAK